jgi:hypothetical protein
MVRTNNYQSKKKLRKNPLFGASPNGKGDMINPEEDQLSDEEKAILRQKQVQQAQQRKAEMIKTVAKLIVTLV